MSYSLSPHCSDLLEWAKQGTDQDWKYVDGNLGDKDIYVNDLRWAIYDSSVSVDRNIRDFGATLLDVSSITLSDNDIRHIEAWMSEESDEITRLRLAIALFKRDDRLPRVRQYFDEALRHPDLAAVAKKFRKGA